MSDLAAALEAILFASHRPLTRRELEHATAASRAQVEAALESLEIALGDRGVMLQHHQDLVQIATRPAYSSQVRRALNPEIGGRLSAAAYETLAIVAVQQPVPKSRIEQIRGVNCDGVLANLELRDLVHEVGRGEGPGQPKLYGTTMRFLRLLGLGSLEDLDLPEVLPSPND
ncbi:MAG TPA: SMC-Scp complex subunit ScpB [Candidatus Nitrosotalea sp.]|nr:SMC-Scp complex subunit ScpB [Candidatus Nitrosotalea sp.]